MHHPRGKRAYLALIALLFFSLVTSCTQGGPPAPAGTAAAPGASVEREPTATDGAPIPPTALPSPTVVPEALGTAPASPAAVFAATSTPVPAATATPSLPAAFSAQVAMEHDRQLSAVIGKRASATEGMRRAADYIAAQLRSYGYQVAPQPFPFSTFEDQGTSLAVQSPEQRAIQTNPLYYSASGDITAPLVDVGFGQREDYAGKAVAGKVVIAQRGGGMLLSDKASNAAAAGAAALIIFNNQPGLFYGTLRERGRIATVAVSDEDGAYLRALLHKGPATVHVKVNAITRQGEGINVVAKGAQPNGRTILLGAHYDSVPVGPGANDNASGVATILELARVLAARGQANHVVVVAFAAEEQGLLGSGAYVRGMTRDERSSLAAMLNFDMVAEGKTLGIRFGGAGAARYAQMAKEAAAAAGVEATTGEAGNDSDHWSFQQAGMPILYFETGIDPYYHTAEDTVDKLQPDAFRRVGLTALGAIDRILQP